MNNSTNLTLVPCVKCGQRIVAVAPNENEKGRVHCPSCDHIIEFRFSSVRIDTKFIPRPRTMKVSKVPLEPVTQIPTDSEMMQTFKKVVDAIQEEGHQ